MTLLVAAIAVWMLIMSGVTIWHGVRASLARDRALDAGRNALQDPETARRVRVSTGVVWLTLAPLIGLCLIAVLADWLGRTPPAAWVLGAFVTALLIAGAIWRLRNPSSQPLGHDPWWGKTSRSSRGPRR